MKHLLGLIAALAMLQVGGFARAQETTQAETVSACGTPNRTPVVGNPYPITQDTTQKLCTSGSGGGGGGTSSNFNAAFPSAGTAIGAKNGANMVNLTADGSNNLNVNCTTGCTAVAIGVTSTNGASTVATGGTFQSALASSGTRKGCLIENPTTATEPLYVFFGANGSATTANSFSLGAGGAISCNAGGAYVLTDNVSVTATTNGHAYVVNSQ